jgi:hypothetical protein
MISLINGDIIPNKFTSLSVGSQTFSKWSCPIPYKINPNLINPSRVIDAMNYITSMTGWSFVERNGHDDYLEFVDSEGCSSYLGKQGGKQDINLSKDCSYGAGIHEIAHAIGVMHEQSRSDRDQFVNIIHENIHEDNKHNFDKYPITNIGHYDYNSIMQYSRWAFSKNDDMTIVPIHDTSNTCYIGQVSELSHMDIIHLNKLIDGPYCSVSYSGMDTCKESSITVCGANSGVRNSLLFTEYELIGQKNGKNWYRSINTHETSEIYYKKPLLDQNHWSIEMNGQWGRNGGDLFSKNWKSYTGKWSLQDDNSLIVSQKQCCGIPSDKIGNGVCNPEANNKVCYWDGGDCCQESCIGNCNSINDTISCNDPAFNILPEYIPPVISCAYADGARLIIAILVILANFLYLY